MHACHDQFSLDSARSAARRRTECSGAVVTPLGLGSVLEGLETVFLLLFVLAAHTGKETTAITCPTPLSVSFADCDDSRPLNAKLTSTVAGRCLLVLMACATARVRQKPSCVAGLGNGPHCGAGTDCRYRPAAGASC